MNFPEFIELSQRDPAKAIAELEEKLQSNPSGFEKRHHWLDLIVAVMTDHELRLEDAERYARELVDGQADRSHLRVLARLCEKLGKSEESAKLKQQARTAPELHMIDEIRKIAEAEGLDISFMDKED
jgi:hypothetical protein